MKRISQYLSLALLVILLSGCASSKRMRRLSAGIAGSYSIPEQQYIRSKKYQEIERHSLDSRYGGPLPTRSGTANAKAPKPFELNENLVNLWPFYFHSGQYTSMLWPLIDWDPYGFAFRPFYNHEGDDYSVLFPLCGWNTEAHDGWFLTAFWDKDGWCVLPFAVWHPEWGYLVLPLAYKSGDKNTGNCMVTPLFFHSWNYKTATPDKPYTPFDKRFWLCALAYYDKQARKDLRGFEYLFGRNTNTWSDALAKELAYRMADTELKPPSTEKEFKDLQNQIFFAQPDAFCLKYGLFPFFHIKSTPNHNSTKILWPLFHTRSNKTTKSSTFSLLGWFGAYYQKAYKKLNLFHTLLEDTTFISIPLLSAYSKEKYVESTPVIEKLRKIHSLNNHEENYETNLEQTMILWKEIDQNLKLPDSVCSAKTMQLFVEDYYRNLKPIKTREEEWGGCLPLFTFSKSNHKKKWTIPLLLTSYKHNFNHDSWSFWSLPLLSHFKQTRSGSLKTVAGPIGWYTKTETRPPLLRTIFSKDTYAPKTDSGLAEVTSTIAACGLYYHGKHSFLIPKEKYDHQTIEKVSDMLYSLPKEKQIVIDNEKSIEDRRVRCAGMPSKTRIQELEKLLEIEYIKEEQKSIDKLNQDYDKKKNEFRESLAKLGFDCPDDIFQAIDSSSNVACNDLMMKIIEKCTTVRSYEDYGTGLFFHRETYENGDGSWSFLFGLAGGRKQGDTEQTQVLQFLYRYTQNGRQSEKLIFPFISVQKDGDNVRRSFLWRLWQHNIKDGKSGGYFFFIPYGD
ncbi:MAG: hypothetical protein J6X55_11020 [Victivallales bacterium]|nr:hypothetical protein [Victivallales bacterium]